MGSTRHRDMKARAKAQVSKSTKQVHKHSTRFCSFLQPWHQIAWNPLTYKETHFYLPLCQDQSGSRATSPDAHGCSVTKSCPALWDPVDCSLPGSSVHGIFQARILEWIAIYHSRSFRPRGWTQVCYVSFFGRQVLYQFCHLRSLW